MKNIADIIVLLPLVATFSLFGCSYTTQTKKLSVDAKESILEFEANLRPECKDESVKKGLKELDKKINNIVATCELELAPMKEQRDKWRLGFWLMVFGVVGYILMKIKAKL